MMYFVQILCFISFIFCEKEILSDNTTHVQNDSLITTDHPLLEVDRTIPSKSKEVVRSAYIGNWPINSEKDKINSFSSECPGGVGCECSLDSDCLNSNCEKQFKGKFCTLKEGDVFPKFIAYDQYGEQVNLYDFANQGKYILLEMGASWCSPCKKLASYFAYKDQTIISDRIWRPGYEKIYDMVMNEEVYFVTVLYEDVYRDNASKYTVEDWYSEYPDDHIPILADEDKYLHRIIKPTGIPAVTLLDENMIIIATTTRGFNIAFDKLLSIKYDD